MKKILISAAVLLFGVGSMSAQSPWFLGGNLGFVSGKDEVKTKTTAFTINPSVGYMLNDNWGLMLDLGYSYLKEKEDGQGESKANAFGGGLGAVYKCRITDMFYFAPTVRVGYMRAKETKVNTIDANLNFLRFELRPSAHWGFNFNFGGLGFENVKPKSGDAANAFGLTIGNSANVGFTYYF